MINELEIILRGVEQEKELLKLIDDLNINVTEPVYGECFIDGWPEIQVIGPTRDFYKELFPDHFELRDYLNEEIEAIQISSSDTEQEDHDHNPCEYLDTFKKAKVTKVNLNSAIIMILLGDKKFLFTGDAGISSFEKIPEHETLLKNIFWIKIPHHGSINNINTKILDLLNPRYAIISGKNKISEELVMCLKTRGCNVNTTRDAKHNLIYQFSENEMTGKEFQCRSSMKMNIPNL